MIRHRYIDRICIGICCVAIVLTVLFLNGETLGLETANAGAPYQYKLFDDTKVHTLDIVVSESDWSAMLASATAKEYIACTVVIDGEAYKNVAIRTKGNTSLSSVSTMDSDRYSFKIEFDHYDNNTTYYGLDKLSLNNIIQDTTYLKDYLSYHLMNEMGVLAPLSSFVSITVNGEAFGLYLAVEGVEEALIQRGYGSVSGSLYKPDNMQMGGSNGGGFGGMDNSASLQYTDDDVDSYLTIWDGAVFDITESDQKRLIESLEKLSAGEDLESVVDVDAVLRYFVAHNFVVNFDSYTGSMNHNYYLYEKDGQLSMIPWDYNLAFGTFSGGMGMGGTSDTQGATQMVNYPIDTPVSGTTLADRPLLGKLLEVPEYLELYHQLFDEFMDYFESGRFEQEYDRVVSLIDSYVLNDPTSFCTYEEFQTGTATLREFCLLRAQSIRGQLDGTIPSTTTGQNADSASLVDASHLSLTDMGGMTTGGGMGGGRGGDMTFPTRQTPTDGVTDTQGDAAANDLAITRSASRQAPLTDGTQTGMPDGFIPPDGATMPDVDQQDGGDADPSTSSNPQTSAPPDQSAGDGTFPEDGMFPTDGTFPDMGNWDGQTNPFGEGGNRGNMGNWPGGMNTAQETSTGFDLATWILLGASVLVLAAGTLFVVKYKKI